VQCRLHKQPWGPADTTSPPNPPMQCIVFYGAHSPFLASDHVFNLLGLMPSKMVPGTTCNYPLARSSNDATLLPTSPPDPVNPPGMHERCTIDNTNTLGSCDCSHVMGGLNIPGCRYFAQHMGTLLPLRASRWLLTGVPTPR